MVPDDFSVGDFITVLKGVPIYGRAMDGDMLTITGDDNSWKGDVLQITAIDFPYIVANILTGYKTTHHFDLRMQEFKKLSKNYVDALLKAGEIK